MKLSDKIKLEVMKEYRYKKQYPYVCSEGFNKSDVVALNDKNIVEIEIKVSKSDLKAEFTKKPSKYNKNYNKIWKHRAYGGDKPYEKFKVPNMYYLCVTPDLIDTAIELIEKFNPKYGLLVYQEVRYTKGSTCEIFFKRRAKKLHKEKPTYEDFKNICKRITSEMIIAKEALVKIEVQDEG